VLRISTARRVADVFWPDFIERDGAILLPFGPAPEPPPGDHATLTRYERFHGHTHIQDLFRWDVPTWYDPEWDSDRPDADSPEHAAAWGLARRMAHMWFARLAELFPSYRFRVYASRLDDPVVHFHRVRDGEPVWVTDEEARDQIARGDALVLDSALRGHQVAAS
jgi:hypothetical protein